MVILDTSIIIDHLRQMSGSGETRLLRAARAWAQADLGISVISIQELYEGRSVGQLRKEQQLLAIVSSLRILPYTLEIAQKAGEIARTLPTTIEFADAAIAATCLKNGYSLLTLNRKHFAHIPELVLED